MAVPEVSCDKMDMGRAGDYTSFYGKEDENNQLGTGLFLHTTLQYQRVKRVEFVSDRMSYIYSYERSLV